MNFRYFNPNNKYVTLEHTHSSTSKLPQGEWNSTFQNSKIKFQKSNIQSILLPWSRGQRASVQLMLKDTMSWIFSTKHSIVEMKSKLKLLLLSMIQSVQWCHVHSKITHVRSVSSLVLVPMHATWKNYPASQKWKRNPEKRDACVSTWNGVHLVMTDVSMNSLPVSQFKSSFSRRLLEFIR